MAMQIRGDVLEAYIPEKQTSRVRVPEGVRIIAGGAFSGTDVEIVRFPSGLEKIGKEAFSGCRQLTGLVFPYLLCRIGESAFEECGTLRSVEFTGPVPEIGKFAFYGDAQISEIRYGGSVQDLTQYYRGENVPVKFMRRYPDMLLTGNIRQINIDKYIVRMMLDHYELTHSLQITQAMQRCFCDMFEELTKRNDAGRIARLLSHRKFLNAENAERMLEFAIRHTQLTGNAEPQMLVMRAAADILSSRTIKFHL
ncbi:MAG: leucine-rich repeat domain-containing protein [Oscillospiraceae bacterium]|nr:leucine-rich repeat domain-containing protein [Oscillospiraceae bacterium]